MCLCLSIGSHEEEEKGLIGRRWEMGHIQDIYWNFDLLTPPFLRIRINKYICSCEGGGNERNLKGGKKTKD